MAEPSFEQAAAEPDALQALRTVIALVDLLPADYRTETLAQGLNAWKAARLVDLWNAFDTGIQTITAAMIERWPEGADVTPMLEVVDVAAGVLAETASGVGIPPDWLPDAITTKMQVLRNAIAVGDSDG